jgi:predicted aspartyl protease
MNLLVASRGAAGLFALLVLSLAGPAAAETCQLKQEASFRIHNDPTGTVSVAARVNDTKDVSLILDTGAITSVLQRHVVLELGLSVRSGAIPLGNARGGTLDLATIPSVLQLGNLSAHKPLLLVGNDSVQTKRDTDGLFAADFLGSYDLELDFGQMRAALYLQEHCKEGVVYWSDNYLTAPIEVTRNGQIIIEVKLNGHPLRAFLDTGIADSSVPEKAARTLLNLKPGDPGTEEHGTILPAWGPRVKRIEARLPTVEFAGLTFHNSKFVIVPDELTPNGAEMTLGMNQLRRLHLYIAYGEGKLYRRNST